MDVFCTFLRVLLLFWELFGSFERKTINPALEWCTWFMVINLEGNRDDPLVVFLLKGDIFLDKVKEVVDVLIFLCSREDCEQLAWRLRLF